MGVSTQADRRFRRAQVVPVRRRRAWVASLARVGRLSAFGMFVIWVGHVSLSRLQSLPALQIAEVRVAGHERLSTEEVQALVRDLPGENIVFTDLNAWRGRLLLSPWIADARLHRTLPSTIDVVVAERVPVMLSRLAGRLYLVDATGVVLDEHGPRYADYDLPMVDGLVVAGSDGRDVVDGVRARLAARLLAAVRDQPALAARVSQVDVSDAHDAVVLLDGDAAMIHLGEERFVERLESYLQLAPALRARVPRIDYVDLRFDDRVYVRPYGSARGQTVVTRN